MGVCMQISGSLPSNLANLTRLTTLVAHQNKFGGRIPPLDRLNKLVSLTLFDNNFGGKLRLPSSANFTLLLAQSNRLSCGMDSQSSQISVKPHQRSLVLPGNTFSAPIPQWAQTHEVTFLYYTSWWESWRLSLVTVLVGLVAGGSLLLWLWRVHGFDWHQLVSSAAAETRIRLWCSMCLAKCSVFWVPIVIAHYAGSHLYECGKPWLYLTAAYLDSDSAVEIVVAVGVCIASGVAAYSVRALESQVEQLYSDRQKEKLTDPISACRQVLVWCAWIPISFVLSAPIALHIVATTLPPQDNVWNIPVWALELFRYAAAPFLYIISALLVPPLSRFVSHSVGGIKDSSIAVQLMIVARLLVSVLVPFVMVVIFNQQCNAFWLQLWRPCTEDSSTFDISLTLPFQIVRTLPVARWLTAAVRALRMDSAVPL